MKAKAKSTNYCLTLLKLYILTKTLLYLCQSFCSFVKITLDILFLDIISYFIFF